MNFSEELSFNQKIITEVHPFEAPVLTRFKLKSVKSWDWLPNNISFQNSLVL